MRDPVENQYKIITALNFTFFMLIIAFLVFFNPFGYFTLNNTEITPRQSSIYAGTMLSFLFLTLIANILFIKYAKPHKKKRK